MLDLVRNTEDRFSSDEAKINLATEVHNFLNIKVLLKLISITLSEHSGLV